MTPEQKALNCPNGITASGTVPLAGRTIACDASKLGSWLEVPTIGKRKCEDVGSAIKGNRIDIYFDTYEEAIKFGKRVL